MTINSVRTLVLLLLLSISIPLIHGCAAPAGVLLAAAGTGYGAKAHHDGRKNVANATQAQQTQTTDWQYQNYFQACMTAKQWNANAVKECQETAKRSVTSASASTPTAVVQRASYTPSPTNGSVTCLRGCDQ